MPRPRTPTPILEMRGAFAKDPQRRRVDPTTPGDIGKPPAYLTKEEKAVWREIVVNAPNGVLTSADRIALEMLSILVLRMRTSKVLTAAEVGQIRALLASFGCTPADRSRVAAAPQKPESTADMLSEFLQ